MYLHLGVETMARGRDIIGVFDMDNATVAEESRNFLARAQKEGRVENVSENLPKSFVLCGEPVQKRPGASRKRSRQEKITVYISQLASATLRRRAAGAMEWGDPSSEL